MYCASIYFILVATPVFNMMMKSMYSAQYIFHHFAYVFATQHGRVFLSVNDFMNPMQPATIYVRAVFPVLLLIIIIHYSFCR